MTEEFNLSENIIMPEEEEREYDFIRVRYVKLFIKKLKERCSTFVSAGAIVSIIDELAGDKLK